MQVVLIDNAKNPKTNQQRNTCSPYSPFSGLWDARTLKAGTGHCHTERPVHPARAHGVHSQPSKGSSFPATSLCGTLGCPPVGWLPPQSGLGVRYLHPGVARSLGLGPYLCPDVAAQVAVDRANQDTSLVLGSWLAFQVLTTGCDTPHALPHSWPTRTP